MPQPLPAYFKRISAEFFDVFGSSIFAISVPLAQQIATTCLILLLIPYLLHKLPEFIHKNAFFSDISG